ncbi:2-hydroxyacid dehydrogenase [Zopfochytrium polystomum]|nr:2-hydroxyacid dehydrogenase [Zopfochytrium polystomum]
MATLAATTAAAIVFESSMANPAPWLTALRIALVAAAAPAVPNKTILLPPSASSSSSSPSVDGAHFDPAAVEVAIVANPTAGSLARYPNLRLIASMWAGVDGLLADPTLPRGPTLVRLVDPEMTNSMAESVLMHSLVAHRQLNAYRRQQAVKAWNKHPTGRFQLMTHERVVGVLGVGELGMAALNILARHGFTTVGWSRTPKPAPSVKNIRLVSGRLGMDEVLSTSHILVNLLPLTPETRGILNKDTFAKLQPGATVINLGRGQAVVEADLIDALDRGIIETAVLDVFEKEPLPDDSPLWSHPRVVVTPHVSALTNPLTASSIIAETIRKYYAKEPLDHIVDIDRGY